MGVQSQYEPERPLSIQTTIDAGGFYSGTRVGTQTTVNYRYRDKSVTSLRVSYFDVNLKEGEFATSIVALKTAYSFTPRIFVQATLQYVSDTKDLGSNIRFGWLSTAGTGLYVVYNDLEHLGGLDRTGIERGPRGRQLIVKYTKQFNLGRQSRSPPRGLIPPAGQVRSRRRGLLDTLQDSRNVHHVISQPRKPVRSRVVAVPEMAGARLVIHHARVIRIRRALEKLFHEVEALLR